MARWKVVVPVVIIIPLIALAIVLIVLSTQGNSDNNIDGPIVETQVGLIRGVKATDGDYYKFMGIPYARVDEQNPFGPSSPHPVFEDIFEADDDSAECPQISQTTFTPVGTLDCLHLNIYVPVSARTRNQLPVMVWIHGGAFVFGSGNRIVYGPKFIMRHDVILVAINYRLAAYGFMCLDIPEVPGNQGLKDQLIALRWIKDNIESFGGDSNRITIFGESAGGMSVDLHLYSDKEKLYNSIIMQSGTALLSTLVTRPNNNAALALAASLGFETTDIREALTFLSSQETDAVVIAGSFGFNVCVENEFDNVDGFLNVHPINQKNIPKAEGIQILIGYNNDESMVNFANRPADTYSVNEFRDPLEIMFEFDNDQLTELEKIVRNFYIGGEEISVDQVFAMADFMSDIIFVYPTERTISKYIDNGVENIYYYVFSYVGGRNIYRLMNNITIGGAVHADELGYLFDVSILPPDVSVEDQLVIDRMTTTWTNFAKYGDPTPDTSDLLPVKWEPITNTSAHYYLNIDSELTLGRRPFHHRMSFWDLFFRYNEHLQRNFEQNDETLA